MATTSAEHAAYTQQERPLALSCVLGEDALLLHSVRGHERLGELPRYDVEFYSTEPALKPASLLGTRATVRVSPPGVTPRVIRAFFATLERCDHQAGRRLTRYRATLVPWMWYLSLNRESRIYQGLSSSEIAKTIITEATRHTTVLNQLADRKRYARRRYSVQYQESSLNYIQRLLEDDGIFYFMRDNEQGEQLVLCDSPSLCPNAELKGILPVRHDDAQGEQEYVWNWSRRDEVRAMRFATSDYNFKVPGTPLLAGRRDSDPNCEVDAEYFEYPGNHMTALAGEAILAERRLEELLTERCLCTGSANCPGLVAGRLFRVSGSGTEERDQEYLATGITFHAQADVYNSAGSGDMGRVPIYRAEFTAIPATDRFRPARKTPKPVMKGPQTATVVGRAGEEVYTDRHARVKVRFHWDRHAKPGGNSSCWIRVSQAWAGRRYGWLAIPRVGHEVIVDFLEGDPDRPIITGRVYNGANMPPITTAGKEVKHKPVKGSPTPASSPNGAPPPPRPTAGQTTPHADSSRDAYVAGPTPGAALGAVASGVESDGEQSQPLVEPKYGARTSGRSGTPRPRPTPRQVDEWMHEDDDSDDALPPGVAAGTQMTTFKSDSLDGEDGANEITINDSGAQEGLFFNAQYNEVHVVGNDRIDQVGKNEMVSVGQNRVEDIGLNAQETVGVAKVIDVGQTLLIKAGTSITLQCGASTIHMNQAGFITISGTVINVAAAANCNMAAPVTSVTGGMLMMTNGMLNMMNGGFLSSVASGGKAAVSAAGDALVQGAKVKLN
jgi:type VI secretion system secreted protein VgrG